ncbi:protein of unknown function (plasmid) [Azospirillum baldaniorum]|uniref:Uncharacterized protein n=1 Tax=Azospirillum baldaniorum TaxID=1064539 RepID=A0A9P1JTV6_9PROT|nr:protein of unknown function [Azospirillum baldaniorum]
MLERALTLLVLVLEIAKHLLDLLN